MLNKPETAINRDQLYGYGLPGYGLAGSGSSRNFAVSIYKKLFIGFVFFLVVSRFFTETLTILPKAFDLINFPFLMFSAALLFIGVRSRVAFSLSNFNTLLIIAGIFLFFSVAFNFYDIFPPASVLYIAGILQGPLLFLALTRMVGNDVVYATSIAKMFKILVYLNILAVIGFSYPSYVESEGDPDKITGTFGLNGYYLSIFLMAAIGYFFGDYVKRNRYRIRINRTAVKFFLLILFFLVTLYLLQYRVAVPFILLSIAILIKILFGNRVVSIFGAIGGLVLTGYFAFSFLMTSVDNTDKLRYGKILEIIQSPDDWFEFGRFQSYSDTLSMYGDDWPSIFVGVGPGNYTSRAYYTFSYEYRTDGKGVSGIVRNYLGLDNPRYTEWDVKYLQQLRGVANYGSYQLSNPNSSYLAAIGELGLVGGMSIISLYLWLVFFSYRNLKTARRFLPALPVAAAAFAGTLYLFLLGFLENYWESARSTVLVWTLNWAAYVILQHYRSVQHLPGKQASKGGK